LILEGVNFRQEEDTTMRTYTETMTRELEALARDARALIAATADVAEQKVCEARKRLEAALDSGRKVYDRVMDKAGDGADAADQTVREYPYQAIAIGVGAGALLGYLLASRGASRRS